MPQCPVCQAEGTIFGSEYKCPNNHVWHLCPEHCKEVVTSLIGETHILPDSCTCGLNCLSPSTMNKNPVKAITKSEPSIHIVANTTHFSNKFLSKIQKANDKFKDELYNKFNIILGARTRTVSKVKLPNPENMPLQISEQGKRRWKTFCKRHMVDWQKYDDPNRQWATAVAIWRNYAAKRNFPPFNSDPGSIDSSTIEYMKNRLVSSFEKTFNDTSLIGRLLLSKKFASRVLIMSLYEVEEISPGKWKVVFDQKLNNCVSFNDKNFRAFLKMHKFYRNNGMFKRDVTPNATIILREDEDATYMYSTFILTNQLISMGLGLSEIDIKNKDKIKKNLVKFFKSNLRKLRKK